MEVNFFMLVFLGEGRERVENYVWVWICPEAVLTTFPGSVAVFVECEILDCALGDKCLVDYFLYL